MTLGAGGGRSRKGDHTQISKPGWLHRRWHLTLKLGRNLTEMQERRAFQERKLHKERHGTEGRQNSWVWLE